MNYTPKLFMFDFWYMEQTKYDVHVTLVMHRSMTSGTRYILCLLAAAQLEVGSAEHLAAQNQCYRLM